MRWPNCQAITIFRPYNRFSLSDDVVRVEAELKVVIYMFKVVL